jgi:hypothetical protein
MAAANPTKSPITPPPQGDHNIPALYFLVQKEIYCLTEMRPTFRCLTGRQYKGGMRDPRALQGLFQSVQMQWSDVTVGDNCHFRPL